jgi:hypothetical protein
MPVHKNNPPPEESQFQMVSDRSLYGTTANNHVISPLTFDAVFRLNIETKQLLMQAIWAVRDESVALCIAL